MIEPGRTGEVVVSEGFAKAQKLSPGDSVLAVINGRRQAASNIVGLVLSPEYVYAIREGELLPDESALACFGWPGLNSPPRSKWKARSMTSR